MDRLRSYHISMCFCSRHPPRDVQYLIGTLVRLDSLDDLAKLLHPAWGYEDILVCTKAEGLIAGALKFRLSPWWRHYRHCNDHGGELCYKLLPWVYPAVTVPPSPAALLSVCGR